MSSSEFRRAILFNDTRSEKHFGCDLVMAEIIRRLADHGVRVEWTHKVKSDWRVDKAPNRAFANADLVIVNGEGSIHHSATRKRASILAQAGLAAKERKIPAYLINATVYAIDDDIAACLRAFDRIYVRETMSQLELASYNVASEVVPDITIAADLPVAPSRSKGVCGTDSVSKVVSTAILQRCRREGWNYKPMRRGYSFFGRSSSAQYSKYLSSHSLVLTGRFHAVAFCIATRTPFVAVESNTPKISALLRDVFGSDRRILPRASVESADIHDFAIWTPQEEEAVRAFPHLAREKIEIMFSKI